MRRTAVPIVALALLAPASAVAAPAPVDRLRGTDGVTFSLGVRAKLTAAGEARFAFTARPEGGAGGEVDSPPIGLATEHALLVGTAIACGSPAATAVFGTVRHRVRRVVATTTDGGTHRLRRVRPPRRWGFGGWVVGRVLGGEAPVTRVEAFSRRGRSIATAEFGDPPACPE